MGFEDVFDLDVFVTEDDLDALDKAAGQAQRRLEKTFRQKGKVKKQFEKKQTAEQKAQARTQKGLDRIVEKVEKKQQKAEDKITRKLEKIQAKINYQTVTGKGRGYDYRTGLQKIFGGAISSNPRVALGFFHSPERTIQSIIGTLPFLGGVVQAKEAAEFLWKELVNIDAFVKRFVDKATTRLNALRDRQFEAGVRLGLTQSISTTQAGTISPRDSYNSYEEFNSNHEALENRFATRSIDGVE